MWTQALVPGRCTRASCSTKKRMWRPKELPTTSTPSSLLPTSSVLPEYMNSAPKGIEVTVRSTDSGSSRAAMPAMQSSFQIVVVMTSPPQLNLGGRRRRRRRAPGTSRPTATSDRASDGRRRTSSAGRWPGSSRRLPAGDGQAELHPSQAVQDLVAPAQRVAEAVGAVPVPTARQRFRPPGVVAPSQGIRRREVLGVAPEPGRLDAEAVQPQSEAGQRLHDGVDLAC